MRTGRQRAIAREILIAASISLLLLVTLITLLARNFVINLEVERLLDKNAALNDSIIHLKLNNENYRLISNPSPNGTGLTRHRSLYEGLIGAGYDVPVNYVDFINSVQDSVNIRFLFERLVRDGYQLGEFEFFRRTLATPTAEWKVAKIRTGIDAEFEKSDVSEGYLESEYTSEWQSRWSSVNQHISSLNSQLKVVEADIQMQNEAKLALREIRQLVGWMGLILFGTLYPARYIVKGVAWAIKVVRQS